MKGEGQLRKPKWLSVPLIEALHEQSLKLFGGLPGVRDRGLLESALARPQNLLAYSGDVSPFELAAAYCAGIVRNHPFVDGNKRAGLLAARAFLFLNGYRLHPDEAETVHVILSLAADELDEHTLCEWLERNSAPLP